jgi:tRNA (cytidine/uridine-2'-O-)-methyltransferase
VHDAQFSPGDWLVFGAETRGLAPEIRDAFPAEQCLKLPMLAGQRSLNLSNAVAVTVFEAWRQNHFAVPATQGQARATPVTSAVLGPAQG